MSPQQYAQLPRAVHRWLSYQKYCGRTALFSEAYLTHPIGEFVNFHHSGSIVPERDHPQFRRITQGRPKQVDFALLTPHTSNVESVIECKWVSSGVYSKQAILDDLLRLECYRHPGCYVRRYFLMGGTRPNFDDNFLSLRYSDGTYLPFTSKFLSASLDKPDIKIDLYNATGSLRKFFRRFSDAYDVELPKRMSTRLIARSRIDGLSVYLWQVSSSRNRHTFEAKLPAW